jgi:hypothetical protein
VSSALKEYAANSMSLPEVHKRLKELLGDKFKDNISYWHPVIDSLGSHIDDEPVNVDDIIAKSLDAVPQLFPNERLDDSPVLSHPVRGLSSNDSDNTPYAIGYIANLHNNKIEDYIWIIPCIVSSVSSALG